MAASEKSPQAKDCKEEKARLTLVGRVCEVATGRFVAFKFAEPGFGLAAGLEKAGWQEWARSTHWSHEEAAIHRVLDGPAANSLIADGVSQQAEWRQWPTSCHWLLTLCDRTTLIPAFEKLITRLAGLGTHYHQTKPE